MSSGRHAAPDLVTVVLGVTWTTAAAAVLALLGLIAQHPCPCDASARSLTPVSVPDTAADT